MAFARQIYPGIKAEGLLVGQLAIFIFCLCTFVPSFALAEVISASTTGSNVQPLETKAPTAQVIIKVTTIRASGGTDSAAENSSAASQEQQVRIDRRLAGLSSKLKGLPFKDFSFVSNESRTIPFKKKEVFAIAGGQSLFVRPLYIEGQEACLWLKWVDQKDGVILDTRTHFEFGQSVILGTDNSPSSGLMLVVDIEPVKG